MSANTYTKEDFLELLQAFLQTNGGGYTYLSGYCGGSPDLSDNFQGFISDSWVIGGMTGGSCWGGGADRSVSADDPCELKQLDAFLEEVLPNLSFLQYKKLAALVQDREWTDREYYGNYREYKVLYVSFEALAECLAEMEIAK